MEVPETRFAKFGPDRIAYQVLGEGPLDLIYMSTRGTCCIDVRWEYPPAATFLRRLASFSRLITFDPRGVGASDRIALELLPTWEEWAEDAKAVLDAVGSRRTAILAETDSVPIAALFAATQPDRTQALVLYDGAARFLKAPDYHWGLTESDVDSILASLGEVYGTDAFARLTSPEADVAMARWFSKASRLSCSPKGWVSYMRGIQGMDIREVLPTIRVPTLVLHRQDAPYITLEQGRDLADRIPGARFEPVPGSDNFPFTNPNTQILNHIEEFLTGAGPRAEADRALAAVLFTDIVGSTEQAVSVGDRRWRNLLESHDAITRTVVDEHGGRLVKSTGDGVLATFDGPGRAILCAAALRDALQPLGIEIRSGLHTGEIELRGDDIGGIGVHVAARVLDYAGPSELLVSAAIPMLVTGSGLEFEDRGEHDLKGVPGPWRLFAVKG